VYGDKILKTEFLHSSMAGHQGPVLIILLLLLVAITGYLGSQIYDVFTDAASSTKQSLQNFDENTCCKIVGEMYRSAYAQSQQPRRQM
jgi:hypothetical protein